MEEYSNHGIKVMVTELDLSALPVQVRRVRVDLSVNFEYKKI
ncbi:hypothetical protein [Thermophagus xiamenensis]